MPRIVRRKSICGYQQGNNHRLEKPIKLIQKDIDVLTNKTPKIWGRSLQASKKIIANRVFERGYREYLKSLKK